MIRSIAVLAFLLAAGGCASGGRDAPMQAGNALEASNALSTSTARASSSAVMFPALNVLDLEATEAFYIGIMGMKPTLRIGGKGDDHQEVTLNFSGVMSAPEASLVLNYVSPRTKPYVFDGLSRIAFRVPDVEALVERIRAAGLDVLDEPRKIEVRGAAFMLAFVEDPNGARIELIQPMAPSE